MLTIIYTDVMSKDFVELCNGLDDFMLSFKDVNKAAYYRYDIRENLRGAFIAYVDNAPAGCAAFRDVSGGEAELKRVYVKEEYRGKGVSSRLLEAVENRLKAEGYHTLTLGTLLSLEAAMKLYQNHGFKKISLDGLYVCMVKEL